VDYSDDTPDIAYTYNRAGKLSQVVDVAGTRTFAYNATLDEVSETISGLYSKTLTRGYDALGRRVSLSVDGVQHYVYGYDDFGRLDHVASFAGEFGYSRLEDSDLVSRMTRPNGIATDWSYEPQRDLVTQVQNGTISTYGYANDAAGRRSSMSRSGSAYTAPDVISYSYNDRGELTGAVSNVDATYSYSYAYDPIGNRVSSSEAGVSRGYTTNSLNQYTSVMEGESELSFSYDMDGSMTYRPVDASSGWTQVWNCENRLVETSKGNTRLTFQYDYLGRRVEKCVYLDNTLTERTFFAYDGFKCVEELDALNGNAILARHLWQSPEAGLDVLLATSDASGISFFLHDANKNVMQSTDASGTLREGYSYAPFGESLGTNRARIGFSSEVFDGRINLVYYNYRYFSLCDGRWARRDPLEEGAGINLYLFVKNSSNNYYDFLGMACCGGQEYDDRSECCIKNKIVLLVEDSAGEKCCQNQIRRVEIRNARGAWFGDSGHSFLYIENTGSFGFYPQDGLWDVIYGSGRVSEDDHHGYDDLLTYSYNACPVTVGKILASVNKDRKNPPKYNFANIIGNNCSGRVCKWVGDGGIRAPFPSWTPTLKPVWGDGEKQGYYKEL
jgi:RHS repeat-associated protein